MRKNHHNELPIRSKVEMLKDISLIIQYLHQGKRAEADLLISDLKTRSIFFDGDVQRDVLIFSEQVHFQYDYDPWHKVTPYVQKAADKLIEDLGFNI
ncbi:MAG: hypothetical protein COT85_06720 [Chlamydiae bacterium CG10_big_fil_rev_8_21_14_0_10_42_34]|nr:MAG: hypothetical protein COT85_06720 [Chlamydiae bacterium CG10_big_fil_rev_8_21_14_0_10_42_34]